MPTLDLNLLRKQALEASNKESSPYGGPRTNPVRGQSTPTTREMIKNIGEWVRENPGTASTIPLSLIPGVGVTGVAGMAALGTAADKLNLFNKKPSEYEEDPGKTLVDIALSSLVAGLGQQFANKAMPVSTIEETPILSRSSKLNMNDLDPEIFQRGRYLIDAPIEMGLPEGYKIFDYSKYPGMVEKDAYLESIGQPRFIAAPKKMGLPDGTMVGNPSRMTLEGTPEGEAYRLAVSYRDPIIKPGARLYHGIAAFNPDPYIAAPNPEEYALSKDVWLSPDLPVSRTYTFPSLELEKKYPYMKYSTNASTSNPNAYRQAYDAQIRTATRGWIDQYRKDLDAGIIDPNAYMAKELDYAINRFEKNPKNKIDRQQFIAAYEPGLVQELEPFMRKIEFDPTYAGEALGDATRPYQTRKKYEAMGRGIDARVYSDVRDVGYNPWHDNRSAKKTESIHVFDRNRLKSPYNLGTWDLTDPRILASIAALSSRLGSIDNNTESKE